MAHAGTNYLAVIVAAAAAWAWGAAWYGVLGSRWMKAARIDPDALTMRAGPFVLSFVADLAIAYVLAGAIGHLGVGQVTAWNGVVSGLIIWAGFVVTVLSVSHRFQGLGWDLTAIDGGHWLGVLLIQGAVIGLMGV